MGAGKVGVFGFYPSLAVLFFVLFTKAWMLEASSRKERRFCGACLTCAVQWFGGRRRPNQPLVLLHSSFFFFLCDDLFAISLGGSSPFFSSFFLSVSSKLVYKFPGKGGTHSMGVPMRGWDERRRS